MGHNWSDCLKTLDWAPWCSITLHSVNHSEALFFFYVFHVFALSLLFFFDQPLVFCKKYFNSVGILLFLSLSCTHMLFPQVLFIFCKTNDVAYAIYLQRRYHGISIVCKAWIFNYCGEYD